MLRELAETIIEVVPHPSFEKHPESEPVLHYEAPFDVEAERAKAGGLGRVPSGVPAYVAGLYEIPLLGKIREVDFFMKMNYLKSKANRLRSRLKVGEATVAEVRKVREYLSRGLEVRNEIVRANLRLVVSIAKKYADKWVSFDELVSEGNLPLMRAVELFDVSKGFRFSTYATWAVRNHLRRYISDRQKLKSRFVSGEEFIAAAPDDAEPSPQIGESRVLRLRAVVAKFFERLSDRERAIVELRYGLSEHAEPLTLSEIGRHLGISKERVRQLALSAVEKMQQMVAGNEMAGMAVLEG
jgi:RNA polymerase primary sigma factor